MEDLLTGNVFGLWRYLPAKLGLRGVLQSARRADGEQLHVPESFKLASLEFWPWLQISENKGIEPDILLRLRDSSGQLLIVLIEAKFKSGKSSFATPGGQGDQVNDQLGKQMVSLRSIAKDEHAKSYALIYLTAEPKFPLPGIQQSIDELELKTHQGSQSHFYWTNWRAVYSELVTTLHSSSMGEIERNLLTDAVQILESLGFSDFTGITSPFSGAAVPNWSMSVAFTWNIPRAVNYEFDH